MRLLRPKWVCDTCLVSSWEKKASTWRSRILVYVRRQVHHLLSDDESKSTKSRCRKSGHFLVPHCRFYQSGSLTKSTAQKFKASNLPFPPVKSKQGSNDKQSFLVPLYLPPMYEYVTALRTAAWTERIRLFMVLFISLFVDGWDKTLQTDKKYLLKEFCAVLCPEKEVSSESASYF